MTPNDRHGNDTKLLLAVAGLVVAGAAALALLAGWSVDRQAQAEAVQARTAEALHVPEPIVRRAAPAPQTFAAELASYTKTSDGGPVAEEKKPAEEPSAVFEIGPDEDFVARALETYRAREFDRSAAYLLAEIDARPQRAWTHYMLGLALWKAGQSDEAAAAMDEAAKLAPGSVKTLVNLSRIHNDREDFESALQAARAALEIDPRDPSALFLEARSLSNLGRLDQAASSVAQSLSLDPGNGYAQNLLGLILIRQGRPADAVEPLSRAVELQPAVAYIQNNLGMAYELSGQPREAVAAYRRAVGCDSGHGKAAANLARLEPTLPPPSEEPAREERASAEPSEVVLADGGANK